MLKQADRFSAQMPDHGGIALSCQGKAFLNAIFLSYEKGEYTSLVYP